MLVSEQAVKLTSTFFQLRKRTMLVPVLWGDSLQSELSSVSKMFDVALASAGAKVALATSYDEEHPPENIIDG